MPFDAISFSFSLALPLLINPLLSPSSQLCSSQTLLSIFHFLSFSVHYYIYLLIPYMQYYATLCLPLYITSDISCLLPNVFFHLIIPAVFLIPSPEHQILEWQSSTRTGEPIHPTSADEMLSQVFFIVTIVNMVICWAAGNNMVDEKNRMPEGF